MNFDMEKFLKTRDEALLSMDKDKLVDYFLTYGVPLPKSDVTFWYAVHQARVMHQGLPMFERAASLRWLQTKGLQGRNDDRIVVPQEDYGKLTLKCEEFGCPISI